MKWFLYALGSAFGAALVTICVRAKLQHIHSLTMACINFFVMFMVLLAICLFQKNICITQLSMLTRQDWLFLIITGAIGGLATLCNFLALQSSSLTGNVVAVDRLSTVFVLALSALILKEGVTLQALLGVLLIVGGIFLVVK